MPARSRKASKKLDGGDLRILRYLQEVNIRASHTELSENVALSQPTCKRRLKSLQERGIIRGFHVDIDPGALGYVISMQLRVRLKDPSLDEIERFESEMLGYSMIRQCEIVSGDDGEDFLLRVVARSMDECERFIERIRSLDNVEDIGKTLSIRCSKTLLGAPMEEEHETSLPAHPETVLAEPRIRRKGLKSAAGGGNRAARRPAA